MVMKQKYGAAKMQKFLAYELDRYLIGRASEQKKELPLARVENQAYIHYRKGSLVMYALADYIGEDNLNRALRAFRDEYAYKGPPYPSATALLARIRAVTPPQYQYVIDDLFESITLYDNRAVSASARPLGGDRYEVTIKVLAKKRKADALGERDRRAARRLHRHRRPRRRRRSAVPREARRSTARKRRSPRPSTGGRPAPASIRSTS